MECKSLAIICLITLFKKNFHMFFKDLCTKYQPNVAIKLQEQGVVKQNYRIRKSDEKNSLQLNYEDFKVKWRKITFSLMQY